MGRAPCGWDGRALDGGWPEGPPFVPRTLLLIPILLTEINGLLTYDRRPKADLGELAKIIGQN